MAVLRLASLTLSHFRSHRRASLDFDGRPVALHGANGAGKTNLIEAISFLSPGRGLRRAAPQDIAQRPDPLGWKIRATLVTPRNEHEIETWAEPGETRSLRVDGKTASQNALASLAAILWLVPSMDRLWIEGAEGRRRFLDRTTMSFLPAHATSVLDYEKAMRERNRLLKDMVRDAAWYRSLEAQMARAGTEIMQNRRAALEALAAAQGGAETAFPAADLALSHPDGPLPDTEEAFGEALAENRPRDLAAGRSLIGPHRIDLHAVWRAKGMPAAECSTGEQKALLISLILANARALASRFGAPPLLLLDEVAAHLDAARRAALYDEICGLGAQAFMTGTGRELFDSLGTRGQVFHVSENAGQTVILEEQSPA